jgi:hypothetical protein
MNRFKEIETFAFFVGYPRSGHSLVGACLDAHPNAVISHELDALALVKNGLDRTSLFDAICEKSKTFYESGNEWSGYSYRIPGMWQGRYENIRLIGDKCGGKSAAHLQEQPSLLNDVKKLALKCRMIHVVRNPFDCIATAVKKQETIQQRKFTTLDLLEKADNFFQKAQTIHGLIENEKEAILTIRHENLLDNSRKELTDLTLLLELPLQEAWLNACASVIWPSARKSRSKIDLWEPSSIDYIQEKIGLFPFLKGYTFDS